MWHSRGTAPACTQPAAESWHSVANLRRPPLCDCGMGISGLLSLCMSMSIASFFAAPLVLALASASLAVNGSPLQHLLGLPLLLLPPCIPEIASFSNAAAPFRLASSSSACIVIMRQRVSTIVAPSHSVWNNSVCSNQHIISSLVIGTAEAKPQSLCPCTMSFHYLLNAPEHNSHLHYSSFQRTFNNTRGVSATSDCIR